MATTYTWAIPKNGLKVQSVNGQENTVTSVNFTVTATDGTNTVDLQSSVKVPLDPNAEFVPFASLTEAKVIDWVKAQLDDKKVEMFEKMLNARLERKANPPARPVTVEAPWAE
jgi:DNA polymerase III delta subunit